MPRRGDDERQIAREARYDGFGDRDERALLPGPRVDDDSVRPERAGAVDRLGDGVRARDLCPGARERRRKTVRGRARRRQGEEAEAAERSVGAGRLHARGFAGCDESGRDERDREPEGGSATGTVAFRGDLAAVVGDDLADDREPEPEAFVQVLRSGVALAKALEHVGEEGRLDAAPGVADGDAELSLLAGHREADGAARRRELDCIREEVHQCLTKSRRVGEHAPIDAHGEVKAEVPGGEGRPHGVDRVRCDLARLARLQVQRDLAPPDLGDVEQVIHEPTQVPAVALDALER